MSRVVTTEPSSTHLSVDRYWKFPSLDDPGSFCNEAVQLARANYFSVGDVGDPDWRNARALPFGDDSLDAIYPGTRTISFILYPFEHPDADTTPGSRTQRLIERDPALDWALKEMKGFPAEEARTEVQTEKYDALAKFVAEIRGYERRQIEEETLSFMAPAWAIDALLYSKDVAYDSDTTETIESFGFSTANSGTVISSIPYADARTLQAAYGLTETVTITLPTGTKEHCFALKGQEKTFGAYGGGISALVMEKELAPVPSFDFGKFREQEMYRLLGEVGITLVKGEDGNFDSIRHETISSENLAHAKESYDKLAIAIAEANSTANIIAREISNYSQDLYWDAIAATLKKRGFDLRQIVDCAKENEPGLADIHILRQIPTSVLSCIIKDWEEIASDTMERISTARYLLQYGNKEIAGMTTDREAAQAWKSGTGDHILWYLLSSSGKKKFLSEPEAIATFGFATPGYNRWRDSLVGRIIWERNMNLDKAKKTNPRNSSSNFTMDDLNKIVSEYLSFATTKYIPSRTQRECDWLLKELPFTRKQINLLSDVLEAYGRAIVAAQQKVLILPQVYSRIRIKLENMAFARELPADAIESIRNNKRVSLVYQVAIKPVPTDKLTLAQLKRKSLISPKEESAGKYLHVDVYFDYDFKKPSDVFKFVREFVPSADTITYALS